MRGARRAFAAAVAPPLWPALLWPALLFTGLLFKALLFETGCVDALGLGDYQNAVAELCKCDVEVPQLDGKCSEVLGERLDSVSEPRREEWLDYYVEHCADSCKKAFACYQQPGTCSAVSCHEDRECCGFSEGGSVFCELTGDEGTCRG